MVSIRRSFCIGLSKSRTEDVFAVLTDIISMNFKKRRGYIEGYIINGIIHHYESPIKPELVFIGTDLVKNIDWSFKKTGIINSLLTEIGVLNYKELSGLMTYYFIHGVREVLKMNLEDEMQLFQVFGVNRANTLRIAIKGVRTDGPINKTSLVGNNDSVSIDPMVNEVRNVDKINSEFLSTTQIDEGHFSEYGEEEEDEIEDLRFGTTFDENWSY